MENYTLIWLKSEQNSKANIEENPTDIPHVKYQDYLNTKETYYKMTWKEHTTYSIHLTKGLFHNPIYFLTKLVIFPKNQKSKQFSRNLIYNKTNNKTW